MECVPLVARLMQSLLYISTMQTDRDVMVGFTLFFMQVVYIAGMAGIVLAQTR